ncbi:hypothetical protein BC833DRAFT_587149 [Globomyces pollinis-pini]|nr:hypothetical protein BC833DRAFT_587149 [Globomyces pollinis-pini]
MLHGNLNRTIFLLIDLNMLFQLLTLATSVLAVAVEQPKADNFIVGDIYFANDCTSDLDVAEYHPIKFGEVYKPKNPTTARKLWWNYPSKEIKLEFFADKQAKTPYATITPTGNYYISSICGLDGDQWNDKAFTVTKKAFVKGDVYFLNENSFVRATRSGL